ncbi:cupin domain-containing protein [Pedobacter aquatilis]|uniref:cupin domain-containing protein n=1 Tax=Pedobacter aquatilis TaxID=351343 RepID=UPI00292EC798|nr:cupin domain-containing protein [Pedobacter aquatilis]
MKFRFCIMLLSLFCYGRSVSAQDTEKSEDSSKLFPLGDNVTNDNFTGKVWLHMLVPSDTIFNSNIGSVSFSAGARTNWHKHAGGQILLITEGTGWYQERGKTKQTVKKGAVIKCLPGVEHWHGATSAKPMTHIAIGTNANLGAVVWLEPVAEKQYRAN